MSALLTREDMEVYLRQEGDTLRNLLPIIEENIREHKLPLRLEKQGEKYILKDTGFSTDAWLNRFITRDQEMLLLKEEVRKLAAAQEDIDQLFSVLITGETGTGKELIALALHGDREGEFKAINCAGMPTELFESELFGHLAGAFTGASKIKEGLMKAASKGTLFLDEIGDLPLAMQSKLLRAIQSKTVRKVGAEKDEKIDCRIVCATHKNLKAMCERFEFREDLYARISTFELTVTPLRQRVEDIIPIVESMQGGSELLKAMPEQSKILSAEMYPYNVRSLQTHVKRYKILGKIP